LGKQAKYIPSAQSITLRHDLLQANAIIKHQAKSMQSASITNSFILFFSVLISLYATKVVSVYNQKFKGEDT